MFEILKKIEIVLSYIIITIIIALACLLIVTVAQHHPQYVDIDDYPEYIDYGILSNEQIDTFNDILDAIANEERMIGCPVYSVQEQNEITTQLGLYLGDLEEVEELIFWNVDTAVLNLDLLQLLYNRKIIIDSRIDEAICTLKEGSNKYKLRQISKYISKRVTYIDNYRETIDALNGKGVCVSYSMLFYKMAARLGIKTYICLGYAGGGYHAWNMVEINGECLYYDVTWYDGIILDWKYISSKTSWNRNYQINNIWLTNLEEVRNMENLDLTWIHDVIDRHFEKQNAMIRASRKANLTRNQLLDTLFEEGVVAVYNLGMEHMYEYLKGDYYGSCR